MIRAINQLIVLFCLSNVWAQDQQPVFNLDSLDDYIERGMEDWEIPGLSIAIVQDGEIIHLKGYGVKSIDSKDPVDENSLFQIASITKSFTATTASILHEEKKLSLSDKVVSWLPYFELKDSLITRELDLYDLLCHRSGFKSYEGDLMFFYSNFSRKEVVEKMATFDISKKFRSSFGYSNSAYTAVGEIIEKATNKSWEEAIQEKILNPLKMYNTMPVLVKSNDLAFGHSKIGDKTFVVDNDSLKYMAPAGSMASSAKDMANWLLAQTQAGKFEDQQVIPFRAIKRTRNAYNMQGMNQSNNAETHFYAYGLGCFVRDFHGALTYQHSGGISGYSSNYIVVPEKKLGIVVLTNTDGNEFYLDLTKVILESFFELPYTDYTKESLALVQDEEKEESQYLDSLRNRAVDFTPVPKKINYTGKFYNDSYGEIEIVKVKNELRLRLQHQVNISSILQLIGENEFLCTFSHYEYGTIVIPFQLKDNSLEEFELYIPNMGDGEYSFKRVMYKKEL